MPAVVPPTIAALPTPPDPNDRATFNPRAYPWSLAQAQLAIDVAAVSSNVYNNALEAHSQASIANTQRQQAQQAKDDAVAALQWAGTFKGLWSGLNGALSQPAAVKHLDQFWLLTAPLANVAAAEPGTAPQWVSTQQIAPAVNAMAVAYTNGRVTSVTEDGVTTSMTYNVSGLVATISYPRGSKTRTETYSYNAAGQVTGMTAVEI